MVYTVFFNDESELPSDFSTHTEAEEYAEEMVSQGAATGYEIEVTGGEVI